AAAKLTPGYLFMAIAPWIDVHCHYDTFLERSATLQRRQARTASLLDMAGTGFAELPTWIINASDDDGGGDDDDDSSCGGGDDGYANGGGDDGDAANDGCGDVPTVRWSSAYLRRSARRRSPERPESP